MVSRSLAIGIGILVLVGLGFFFVSTMTGNVVTGSVVVPAGHEAGNVGELNGENVGGEDYGDGR